MDFFEGVFALFFMMFCFAVWVLPIFLIAISDKTSGKEKAAWILATIFITWFAWVFYLLLAPIKPRERYSRRYY